MSRLRRAAALSIIALLGAGLATAPAANAASAYDHNSPTHVWSGGYTCADDQRIVSANYVSSSSTGAHMGAVQVLYSPRCNTYWAQVFDYVGTTDWPHYWFSAAIVRDDGSDIYCQFAEPSGFTGGGCYTAMLDKVSGRNYQGKGIMFHQTNQNIVAFGETPFVDGTGAPTGTSPQYGFDVSHYQGSISWSTQYSAGARFTYIKATEGTSYTDPNFATNYNGSYGAGFIRGAYHFARPDVSAGSTQADYFISHGGGWSGDGRTLPGALDLEAGCYGKSTSAMASWISSFSNQYHAKEGVYPVVYTTASWWSACVGSAANFGATNPLWVARYSSAVGTLPSGWSRYAFWQNADSGKYPGDQDRFNGTNAQLQALARG